MPADEVMTRSRVVLHPVENERGEAFGTALDTACLMNDLFGDQAWDAARVWVNTRGYTEYSRRTILAQYQALQRIKEDDKGFGPDLVEVMCDVV